MEIKATEVKALRERTGAGMMDCKKALIQSEGDFAAAEKHLRELGLAAAAKRSGKAANEGRIFSAVSDSLACMLELSCETDFVSRNADFIATGDKMIGVVVRKGLIETDDEVNALVDDLRSSIKENISLKRIVTLPGTAKEVMVDYLHGEGKIGVLVKLETDSPETAKNEKVKEFAFDCALHVAAYNPTFLNRERVDAAYIEEQRSIFAKQTEGLEKPEKVIEGIVTGKLNKHMSEVVFLEQGFVKEEKTKVSDMAKKIGKEVGGTVAVTDYRYIRVGVEA